MKLRNKHTLKICAAVAMLAIGSCILAGCSSTPSSSSQTVQKKCFVMVSQRILMKME